jgi:hypothetical protein
MSATATRLLALACPRCAGELRGLAFDLLFACPACGVSVEPESRACWAWEEVAAPGVVPATGPLLFLPLWAFPATLAWTAAPAARTAGVAAVAARIRTVYVPAFALARADYFGEPGLAWTRRQDVLVVRASDALEPRAAPVLTGIRRTAATASAYVLATLLAIADETADITGIEARVTLGTARLLAAPCFDGGDAVTDAITGLCYPQAILDDLEGVRAVQRGTTSTRST